MKWVKGNGRSVEVRVRIYTMNGKGRELVIVWKVRKVNIMYVQERTGSEVRPGA